ncbi:MAG: CHAT domain-containing protein [Ekhidna sp.]
MKRILVSFLICLFFGTSGYSQDVEQLIEQYREAFKKQGYSDELIEATLSTLKKSLQKAQDTDYDSLRNATYQENYEKGIRELEEIKETKGRYSKDYYYKHLSLIQSAGMSQTGDPGFHQQQLQKIKFELLGKYGSGHPKYLEITYVLNTSPFGSSKMTSGMIKSQLGQDPSSYILEKEFLEKDPCIANIVYANTSKIVGSEYGMIFNNYLGYSQTASTSSTDSEIKSRLGIQENTKMSVTVRLLRKAYLNSSYSKDERQTEFYGMLKDLSEIIDKALKKLQELRVTPEEAFKTMKEKGLYSNYDDETLMQLATAQAQQINHASQTAAAMQAGGMLDMDGLEDLSQEAQRILARRSSLENDLERFVDFYALFYHKKNIKSGQRLTYLKGLKYDPKLLIQLCEYLLGSDVKLQEKERKAIEIVRENYDRSDLQNTIEASASELDKWVAYREVLLNIFLEFQAAGIKHYDRNTFLTIDDLLAQKGADFKSKKFLVQGIRQANEPALTAYYEHLKERKSKLSALALLSEPALTKTGWRQDKLDLEISEIRKKEGELYGILGDYLNVSDYFSSWNIKSSDIRRLLSTGEVFIDAQRIQHLKNPDKITYLFIRITKDRGTQLFYISEGADLENSFFKVYSRSIKYELNDLKSYNRYWKPFTSDLNNINTIYFSADGIYHKLSLNALKNPATQKFLLEETKVIQINELSDFKKIKDNISLSSQNDQFHFFGRPSYYLDENLQKSSTQLAVNISDSATRSFSENSLIKDLPATEIEVSEISDLLKKQGSIADVYLGEEANESKVKSLNGRGVIHIATHGFFTEEATEKSFGNGYFSIQKEKVMNNPYLRCGLLLAGSGNSLQGEMVGKEDGILTGEEIVHLPLLDTDLVVLSACETGLGTIYNGEGIMGLQRSFLIAGSKSVIMSLWEVNDVATQKLMTSFYNYWIVNGKEKREAFRLAQIELSKEFPEPKYWSAFVMLGE